MKNKSMNPNHRHMEGQKCTAIKIASRLLVLPFIRTAFMPTPMRQGSAPTRVTPVQRYVPALTAITKTNSRHNHNQTKKTHYMASPYQTKSLYVARSQNANSCHRKRHGNGYKQHRPFNMLTLSTALCYYHGEH